MRSSRYTLLTPHHYLVPSTYTNARYIHPIHCLLFSSHPFFYGEPNSCRSLDSLDFEFSFSQWDPGNLNILISSFRSIKYIQVGGEPVWSKNGMVVRREVERIAFLRVELRDLSSISRQESNRVGYLKTLNGTPVGTKSHFSRGLFLCQLLIR